MKFLCDAMLAHVGRWLRAAGYDARIDSGQVPDRELVATATQERRWLLTCDRGIERLPGAREILIHLPVSDELAWARRLIEDIGVDWEFAPFTRCLLCNENLVQAAPEIRSSLPKFVQDRDVWFCQSCDQAFWEGSHVARMRTRLKALNQSAVRACKTPSELRADSEASQSIPAKPA